MKVGRTDSGNGMLIMPSLAGLETVNRRSLGQVSDLKMPPDASLRVGFDGTGDIDFGQQPNIVWLCSEKEQARLKQISADNRQAMQSMRSQNSEQFNGHLAGKLVMRPTNSEAFQLKWLTMPFSFLTLTHSVLERLLCVTSLPFL